MDIKFDNDESFLPCQYFWLITAGGATMDLVSSCTLLGNRHRRVDASTQRGGLSHGDVIGGFLGLWILPAHVKRDIVVSLGDGEHCGGVVWHHALSVRALPHSVAPESKQQQGIESDRFLYVRTTGSPGAQALPCVCHSILKTHFVRLRKLLKRDKQGDDRVFGSEEMFYVQIGFLID